MQQEKQCEHEWSKWPELDHLPVTKIPFNEVCQKCADVRLVSNMKGEPREVTDEEMEQAMERIDKDFGPVLKELSKH